MMQKHVTYSLSEVPRKRVLHFYSCEVTQRTKDMLEPWGKTVKKVIKQSSIWGCQTRFQTNKNVLICFLNMHNLISIAFNAAVSNALYY